MKIIYHIFISLFYFASGIAGLFYRKAALFYSGRKGLLSRIEKEILTKNVDKPLAWFHCASVGEFEQARPVIEQFKEKLSDYRILITFFSPSGYELRKNYPLADNVCYLPMDTKSNAVRFIDAVNPSVVIFVKYELWRNYLLELKKREIDVYLISAHFRVSQPFFKWWGRSFREVLHTFKQIFVQDERSLDLLSTIGIDNVTVSGDTRFDRVYEIAKKGEEIGILRRFVGDSICCVAGSTWPPDEAMLVSFIKDRLKSGITGLKFIIAPHEVGPNSIGKISDWLGDISHIQLSQITNLADESLSQEEADEILKGSSVLIIDTIGVLSKAYKYGSFAYIGGGFGAGIHNILEPATFGLPIVFGPKYSRFKEAWELISLGGAFSIEGQTDLDLIFNKLIADAPFRKNCSETCIRYVSENTGATDKIMNALINLDSHPQTDIPAQSPKSSKRV